MLATLERCRGNGDRGAVAALGYGPGHLVDVLVGAADPAQGAMIGPDSMMAEMLAASRSIESRHEAMGAGGRVVTSERRGEFRGGVRRVVGCGWGAVIAGATGVRRSWYPGFQSRYKASCRRSTFPFRAHGKCLLRGGAGGAFPEPGLALTAAWYRYENGHQIRRSDRVFLGIRC